MESDSYSSVSDSAGRGAAAEPNAIFAKLSRPPVAGAVCLVIALFGLALGHTTLVLQRTMTGGMSVIDTLVSAALGLAGFALIWIGFRKPEAQASLLGYLGGSLIWIGIFEWTWEYFGHWLALEPVTDDGMAILSPGLLMIQSTGLLVIAMLVFLGSNKDTRCRMFLWFHRNFRLRPGRMTPGYQRQFSRITAMETVFITWFIYLCAIVINDPRLIGYDSTAAIVITVGFVIWGIYLAGKLLKIRGLGASLRYAIPTANILWLPTEAFSRWGLYPEVWIKPVEYAGLMSVFFLIFCIAGILLYHSDRSARMSPEPA